jgi:hypothetical protein
MKNYYIFLLFITLNVFKTNAQWGVHVKRTFINTDSKTIAGLTTLQIEVAARLALTEKMKNQLKTSRSNMQKYMDKQYHITKKEKKLDNNATTTTKHFAFMGLTTYLQKATGIPYMSKSKKTFIQSHNAAKLALMAFVKANSFKNQTSVISDNRHEVYRLKKEILKQISKKDVGAVRKIAMSVVGLLVFGGNNGDNKKTLERIKDYKTNID